MADSISVLAERLPNQPALALRLLTLMCGLLFALEGVRVVFLRPPVLQRQGKTWFRPSPLYILAQDAKLALVLVLIVLGLRLNGTPLGNGWAFAALLLCFVLTALVISSIRARARLLGFIDNGVILRGVFREEVKYPYAKMARVVHRRVDDPDGPAGTWVCDEGGQSLFELTQFERADLVLEAIRSHREVLGMDKVRPVKVSPSARRRKSLHCLPAGSSL